MNVTTLRLRHVTSHRQLPSKFDRIFNTCGLSSLQVVTDAQWEARAERFSEQPPKTREYYLLRAIFQKHFPSKSAYETVPRVRLQPTCNGTVGTVARTWQMQWSA